MCAIGEGRVSYCWGKNTNGELGIGVTSNETVLVPDPPVVGNHAFENIAAGGNHACALTTAGKAYCWGVGTYGAIGDGTGSSSADPRAVAENHIFKMIGVGDSFACGLTAEGAAYCWGYNGNSQLGTITGECLGNTVPCSATPVAVSGGYVFESFAVRFNRACGVTVGGDIYCWGLGFGSTPTRFRSVIAAEPGGVRFSIVDIGGNHICAVSASGDAWCRGSNNLGQLGNGTYGDPIQEPTLVTGGIRFRTP
jgi:alpha-tubulin suppressor-like RCC1 family protein